MKNADKFWGDVWKAWWGCCFWEREVWGDDIHDLLSCLRKIMALKYRGLVQRYSTNRPVIRGSFKHERMNVFNERAVREVWRTDTAICEWLGPLRDKNGDSVLGYLAPSGFDDTIFEAKKSKAVSITVTYAKGRFNSNVLYNLSKLTQGSFTKEYPITYSLFSQQSSKLSATTIIQFLRRNMFRQVTTPFKLTSHSTSSTNSTSPKRNSTT